MASSGAKELTHCPPRGCVNNYKSMIFKLIIQNDTFVIQCEIALRWIPQNLTNEKSPQVMAWCHQATSHYLSQCWPRSWWPYGITRPQWVKSMWPSDTLWRHRFGQYWLKWGLLPDCTKPLPEPIECWLIIKYVLYHSPESSFTRSAHEHNL